MSTTAVRPALESDEDHIIGAIGPTFAADPPARRTFPESLARVDRNRVPACLESTNPANIPLCERLAFEHLETVGFRTAPPPVSPRFVARHDAQMHWPGLCHRSERP